APVWAPGARPGRSGPFGPAGRRGPAATGEPDALSLLHDAAARALHVLDPEDAHRAAVAALKLGLGPRAGADDPVLAVRIAGLDLPNCVGLAAGFDKNAEAPGAMLRAGFGFVELGAVTPLPQAGNPRPRLFRLSEDRGVINRMGFNNQGLDV